MLRRMGLMPDSGESNNESNNGVPSKPAAVGDANIDAEKKSANQQWQNGNAPTNPQNTLANQQSQNGNASNKQQNNPPNQNWQNGTAPNKLQNTPVNPMNGQSNQGREGGYIQGPQSGNAAPQQPANTGNVQQGGPNRFSNKQSSNYGVQGESVKQRAGKTASTPKEDYVYYDGNGNQVPPGGQRGEYVAGPVVEENGVGSEKHFHHYYYYNGNGNQQQQQTGNVNPAEGMKKKKKMGIRGHVAAHVAAALVTCWVCTCCCHVPCGF